MWRDWCIDQRNQMKNEGRRTSWRRSAIKETPCIKYIDKLQSGPPLDHFTAHPYGDMRPYVCIVFHECIFLPKLIEISWNYLCNQLPKVEKLKKGENSDQKAIGPLSQGRVPFKLLVQIAKGDVFEGHPGRNKCEMTEMGLENRFTWKIASKLILAVRPT